MKLTARLRDRFDRWILQRPVPCFAVLGLSFIGFGAGTLNLATMLKLHIDLVLEYGWQALMDGAALELVKLLALGYISMWFYVIFKACEHRLVHRLTRASAADDRTLDAEREP